MFIYIGFSLIQQNRIVISKVWFCSCVVVEDSAIGLSAAKSAGMKCIVTKSG